MKQIGEYLLNPPFWQNLDFNHLVQTLPGVRGGVRMVALGEGAVRSFKMCIPRSV